jgi:histidyl-tRNA synthetase
LLRIATDQQVAPGARASAQVVVCTASAAAVSQGQQLARELRNRALVVADVSGRGLDKKLREAGRLGARLALLVGLEEGLILRDLQTREQHVITDDTALDAVSEALLRAAREPAP